MAYFAALAMLHRSQLFGLAFAICYSGLNSFGIHYEPHCVTLSIDARASRVVVGHVLPLVPAVAAQALQAVPEQLQVFRAGINYYWPIALGTALLLGSSPWYPREDFATDPELREISGGKREWPWVAFLLVYVVTWGAAMGAFFLADVKAVGAVLTCFVTCSAMDLVMYSMRKTGFVPITVALGAMLYGAAMLVEKYGHHLYN